MSNEITTFEELSNQLESRFQVRHFPDQPQKLYDAAQYLLSIKGKRVRPVLCLMSNELFGPLMDDAYFAAFAIELFHNFTLVHDDIMDHAPLRRGQPTVHEKFDSSTALLAGDVMLVKAYEYLNKINVKTLPSVLLLFNETAAKVCEGQQMDMDFESSEHVALQDYEKMIALKTSVLLAASMQMGALLGGAGLGNQQNLYEVGKNLGMAFQVQDDYLDAFGDPQKFGKKIGGDILANKKTFLWLKAMQDAPDLKKKVLKDAAADTSEEKIQKVITVYKECSVDEWAMELKQKYFSKALAHLDEVAVVSQRKKALINLAHMLLDREF